MDLIIYLLTDRDHQLFIYQHWYDNAFHMALHEMLLKMSYLTTNVNDNGHVFVFFVRS